MTLLSDTPDTIAAIMPMPIKMSNTNPIRLPKILAKSVFKNDFISRCVVDNAQQGTK